MRKLQIVVFFLVFHSVFGQDLSWTDFKSEYLSLYQNLKIPALRLAYQDNFKAIETNEELERQLQLFEKMEDDQTAIQPESLTEVEEIEYGYFKYVIDLHKSRLKLESQWAADRPESIPSGRMNQLKNHKLWYEYYLKRWLDSSVNVDSLFAFGLAETERAKSKIEAIRLQTGKGKEEFSRFLKTSTFLSASADSVQESFEDYEHWLQPKLAAYFPDLEAIPSIRIRRGENPDLAQVPGYYSSNTFYYNMFDKPFNKRQLAFLYLHEALPGHHYEVSHRALAQPLEVSSLMNLPGYGEGWAAYVEEMGYELGLYRSIYDELGRWEWDLIRSVRVVLDIGLNYHGWSDEYAMSIWKQHISDQDDIGQREIARMRNWPVQVITYKYGASKLLEWKCILKESPGFNLMDFHKDVLRYGPIPYSVLENYLLNKIKND